MSATRTSEAHSPSIPAERARPYTVCAAALIAGLLLFRIGLLLLNPSGLHGDEAQYWAWAQDPAFGYYSKPPLIAWIIWVTTALFGDAEWAVRLASPFLHAGTAALTYLTAKRLFDARVGWWASAAYGLMPGVALSASLISTDAALLFCIALFLYAWVRLREAATLQWAALMGVALGLGLLAKYAMIYVIPALGLALLFDRPTRKGLVGLRGFVAAALSLALITPNLIWNARNDFATFSHTRDNANLEGGLQLNPGELLEFVGGQFGVFGPLSFVLLLVALGSVFRAGRGQGFKPYLWLMIVTPLVVISLQALISRANANWAAAAYAAAPILLAAWVVGSHKAVRWLCAALVLNLVVTIGPSVMATSPQLIDRVGLANAVKRQRGWPETADAIAEQYEAGAFDAVAVDNRLMFYALTYYGMEERAPLFMWRYEPRLNSHAELTSALPQDERRVLIASYYEVYAPYFMQDFDKLKPLGRSDIELGGGKIRSVWFYAASGYNGPAWRD